MADEPRSQPSYRIAVFLGSTAFVMINFGLPIRADDLGIDAVAIGGMYTTFTGTMLLVRPLVGYCLDRLGRRWFFTLSFFFYACAMFVFSRSTDIYDFYLSRGLQGVGASLMWVSARTIVADLHGRESRGIAMGRLSTASAQGSMFGAFYGFTLLGMLPFPQAWSYAFIGYGVAALAALVWSLVNMVETRTPVVIATRLHVPWSWPLAKIFIVVFLSMFASALIEPIYLLYLKNKFAVGIHVLAFAFFPAGIVFAILPRYAGQWSDRFGRAPIIALGIAFAGMVSLALPFWPSLPLVAMSYILFAVGWAMASPAEEALVADLAPPELRGTVIGAKEAAGGAGAALGPLVGGYVYEYWSAELAFAINGGLLLGTALLALVWFSRSAHRT
jgi:MFS family permease